MRKTYVLPRLVLLAIAWIFFLFAFDPILKWAMIKGLEKSAKAKVEIASLHTTFLHPSIRINGFAVADSKSEYNNLVEFSELSFSAAGAPLLEKKVIVENASLSGLRFGTPRRTSGRLAFVKEQPSELVEGFKKESGDFALDRAADAKTGLAADYKVDPAGLESVRLAKQLEESYQADYKTISASVDTRKYQDWLDALKARYEKARSAGNPARQAREYAGIAKDAKKLAADFKKDKENAETALARAKDSFKAVDEARKKDLAAVMSKMKLPAMDTRSLARMLAGPVIAEKTAAAMKWVALARKYMPASSKNVLKKETKRGRTVYFPKAESYPNFLVRTMSVSGELGTADPLEYKGEIRGLTTQPQVYGRPTTALIKGAKGARKLDLRFSLDASGKEVKTDSSLVYTGIPVNGLQLGSPSSFMVDITGAAGTFDGTLRTEGENLSGKAALRLAGAVFKPKTDNIKAAPLRSAVEASFAGLSSALIETDISGTIKSPGLSINTDLASALSKAFSGAMGEELKKARDEAQKKVDEALKPYRSKLDDLASSKQAELGSRLTDAQSKISGLTDGLLKNLVPGKIKIPKFKL